MRSRLLVVVVVLVLAAAIGWWWRSTRVEAEVAAPAARVTVTEGATESSLVDAPAAPESRLPNEARVEAVSARDAEPKTPAASENASATPIELPFFGRVLAKADGLPIAGATIGPFDEQATWDETAFEAMLRGAPLVKSASDGSFEVKYKASERMLLRIDAVGFARRFVGLRAGHETPERALVVELPRAARLHVSVVGATPPGSEPLTLFATAGAQQLVQRESPMDFFGLPNQRWRADVASDGSAILLDLPPNVELELALLQGSRVLLRHPEQVTLAPDEERNLAIELGVGATIVGVVRDDGERPVAGAALWLREADSNVRAFRSGRTNQHTTADAGGAFEFADVGVGKWQLGLETIKDHDARDPKEVVTGLPIEVLVAPSDRRITVNLRVTRGLSITGRVVDHEGHGIQAQRVTARGSGVISSAISKVDGAFTLAPVSPGPIRIYVDGAAGWSGAETVANAGDRDVTLVVERIGSIVIRAVDENGTPVSTGELMWLRASDGPFGPNTWMTSLDPGDNSIDELTPGPWDVIVTTPGGGFGAERIDVATGEPPKHVTIRTRPGGTLRVHAKGATLPILFAVWSGDRAVGVGNATNDDGVVTAVPAGNLRVEWRLPNANETKSREIRLEVGQRLDVELDDG
ncbi:MAG: carboxypeptidase-like regulatory domain-containing protein [Planctomycetes bacterium]|nr:carboxypeptidase-like regulatory domain-containing protein [Planctomycetota bacterium]